MHLTKIRYISGICFRLLVQNARAKSVCVCVFSNCWFGARERDCERTEFREQARLLQMMAVNKL